MASSAQQDEYEITSINVTPLVDIMLVLLIIFMVTTTYIVKEAFKIELPKAASAGEATPKTLLIMVTKEGQAILDGAPVTEAALVRAIRATPGKPEDIQAVIGADRSALHGAVVRVLDVLKGQGVTKFAIQIEKEQGP